MEELVGTFMAWANTGLLSEGVWRIEMKGWAELSLALLEAELTLALSPNESTRSAQVRSCRSTERSPHADWLPASAATCVPSRLSLLQRRIPDVD